MFCNIGNVRVSGCRDIDVMYKYPIGLTDKRFKVIKKCPQCSFFTAVGYGRIPAGRYVRSHAAAPHMKAASVPVGIQGGISAGWYSKRLQTGRYHR